MNYIYEKYLTEKEKELPEHLKKIIKQVKDKEKELAKFGFTVTDRTPKGYGVNEGSGTDLDDKIYRLLIQLPEFKRLPMDKQGTITMKIAKLIK